jgi:cobalt/nickel transport system permease protein
MPSFLVLSLWAVHISDGVLSWPWVAEGFGLAGALALLGAWRIRDEEIPRIAVLSAAFFVASLIHVKVGPTSVHLLLNGLVGVILGWRAALAIPVGLLLQAVLLGHGGFTAVGINSCIMVLPAILAWLLFAVLRRVPVLPLQWFLIGMIIGTVTVFATLVLNYLVLVFGGQEDWKPLAQFLFVAHLPVVIIEGIILGFTVSFLVRVKPEMLGLTLPEKAECSADPVS